MSIRIGTFALLAVALFGVACSSEAVVGKPTGSECPTEDVPTYESFGRDFLTKYCTDCHASDVEGSDRRGAPSDHNFDTFDGFLDAAEHIDELAAAGPDSTNEIMPEGTPKPTLAERKRLGQWVACELEAHAADVHAH